jgi:hypothetical protein
MLIIPRLHITVSSLSSSLTTHDDATNTFDIFLDELTKEKPSNDYDYDHYRYNKNNDVGAFHFKYVSCWLCFVLYLESEFGVDVLLLKLACLFTFEGRCEGDPGH